MYTWHLILAYFGGHEMVSLAYFSQGYTVLAPGYYILLEKRGQDGSAIGYKVESPRFAVEQEAIDAFEKQIQKAG